MGGGEWRSWYAAETMTLEQETRCMVGVVAPGGFAVMLLLREQDGNDDETGMGSLRQSASFMLAAVLLKAVVFCSPVSCV